MKTAVIITGQSRTLKSCRKTIEWNLLRKLKEPHVFASVADDADADALLALGENYPLEIEKVKQPEIEEPDPKRDLDGHAGWQRSATVQNILKQFWALEKGWDFSRGKIEAMGCDLIVRCRPDLYLQDIRMPDPRGIEPNDCWTPWWGTFGGVNDRLAIMGIKAAAVYFTTFSRREQLWKAGCPLHPETMLRASLEKGGVKVIQKWMAEFKICRKADNEHPMPWLVPEGVLAHELASLNLT